MNWFDEAEKWAEESLHRSSPEAGVECLLQAEVSALLAIAEQLSVIAARMPQ